MNWAAKGSISITLPVLLSVSLAGCVTANFTEPVTSFRDSVNKSGAVVSTYYTELNQFEREVYLDDALYSAKQIGTTDAGGQPTPLAGKALSPESIKARTDAIALLGAFAQRLGELAGSEAPKQFSEGASALGENLFSLNKTFEKLGQDSATQKAVDKTAKDYAGPIGAIVGALGKMYLENRRDAALQEAINNGAPPVRAVLSLLQQDLATSIEPLQETGLKQELAERVNAYNTSLTAQPLPSFDQRRAALNDVGAAAARYDAAITANPADLIQNMRQAFEALLTYANSSRAPTDLAQLVTALQTFKNNVDEVATQVNRLLLLRKGQKT